ncbi:MEDIATOR OF RNA polymerase II TRANSCRIPTION SUBUNIT 31 [Salix viminalis]|uniref:Mediator of RNA polymerase II transcription subunit 31 n=1 Tax=Salix viminalis TaxID=40686 RepID=A0A9Q0SC81_SALVM|nr:MEDIATOR OF RNA polymerase II TRANSCRIPTION SUBUNIT 31 [Salix viminalis]
MLCDGHINTMKRNTRNCSTSGKLELSLQLRKCDHTWEIAIFPITSLFVASISMASPKEADNNPDTPSSPRKIYKDPDDGRQRFLLELEFVQCLANPTYIHYLAQNRYFDDEAFIGYLKYLQYWQRPDELTKNDFFRYPHCLYFLELLQNVNFRNAMAHPGNKELAHRQQFFFLEELQKQPVEAYFTQTSP